MVKPQRQYTVASWDPLYYRLFHRFIEGAKDLGIVQRVSAMGQNLPNVPVLPITFLAGFLSLVAIDAATHKSEAYDWNNGSQTGHSQAAQANGVDEGQNIHSGVAPANHGLSAVIHNICAQAGRDTCSSDINSVITSNTTANTDTFSMASSDQQSLDRLQIDTLLSAYKSTYGRYHQKLISLGELQRGMLLYKPTSAKEILLEKGFSGKNAVDYKNMDPEIVAIVHSIPGLPRHIQDEFPAIIGIESDFRIKLGPNQFGACGLTQVTKTGGYPDFLSALVGNSEEAKQFRAAHPRLVSGMDYAFEDMLHHVQARDLLAFYSGVYSQLDKEIDDSLEKAKFLRAQKQYAEAEQLELQASERKQLQRDTNSLRNFLNSQIDYLSDNFDESLYNRKKQKYASGKLNLDALMKTLVNEYPELAESSGVSYKPNHDWLTDIDLLESLRSTWLSSRFHPVFNTFMGAFIYTFDYFKVNNHEFVKERDLDEDTRRALVQRAYNAGWSRIMAALDNRRLPSVSTEYVQKHEKRNDVYQSGHRLLYDAVRGIHAAESLVYDAYMTRLLHANPGRNFYTTDVRNLVRSNTGSNAARRNF